jgi:hypothetical protein
VPHPRWTRPARALAITVGVLALVGSMAVLAPLVDGPMLAATWRTSLGSPLGAGLALAAYLGAFLVRAALWQRVVPQLRLGQALAAIHLALAGDGCGCPAPRSRWGRPRPGCWRPRWCGRRPAGPAWTSAPSRPCW